MIQMTGFLKEPVPRELKIRVDSRGRMVIPAAWRKALGIRDGDPVHFVLQGDELVITSKKWRIKGVQIRLRKYVNPNSVADHGKKPRTM